MEHKQRVSDRLQETSELVHADAAQLTTQQFSSAIATGSSEGDTKRLQASIVADRGDEKHELVAPGWFVLSAIN